MKLSFIRVYTLKDDDATFDDMTQVDKTYVGGKSRSYGNGTQGRSLKEKKPVFGMVSDGKVYAQVVPNAKAETLLPIIIERVKEGSTIISDGLASYNKLSSIYIHKVILHSEKIYAVDGSGYITTSTDGVNWTTPKKAGVNDWYDATYRNGKFVVVGTNGCAIISIDGETWTTPEKIKDESGNAVTVTLRDICLLP